MNSSATYLRRYEIREKESSSQLVISFQVLGTIKSSPPHDAPATATPSPPPASQAVVVASIEAMIGYVGPPMFETSETLTWPAGGKSQLMLTFSPFGQVMRHCRKETSQKDEDGEGEGGDALGSSCMRER